MRLGTRLIACLAAASFLALLIAWRLLLDLGNQYSALAYLQASFSYALFEKWEPQRPAGAKAGDKIIVMAKMESEDTSWVEDELPR